MAYAMAKTIGDDLLNRVVALLGSETPVDPFTIKTLKRDSDKLQGVDAIHGSLVKSAIASLEWDRDEALRWANNMIALEDNAENCFNAAVSMRHVNDLESSAKFAIKCVGHAPHNLKYAHHSAKMLEMAGLVKESNEIFRSIKNPSEEILEDSDMSNRMLEAMHEIGIQQDRVVLETQVATKIATDMKIRISFISQGFEFDPKHGDGSYFVSIKVPVDFSMVLQMEENLALQLSDLPDWNPLKLSIEFHVDN